MIVFVLMTPYTGVGCVVIVPVVTGDTLIRDDGMRPGQDIILIMNPKCGWIPVGFCGMTGSTFGRNIEGLVVRVNRLIIIGHMTGITIVWCALIPGRVTFDTINSLMCPGEREI